MEQELEEERQDGVGEGASGGRRASILTNAPIVQASSSWQCPVPPLETMTLSATAQQNRVLAALRCTLIEVERVKLHGLTEPEVARVKADVLADLETAFLERNQTPSVDFIGEAVDHFLRGEPLMDLEEELELCRQQLENVSEDEAAAVAADYLWGNSCLCTVRMPKPKCDGSEETIPPQDSLGDAPPPVVVGGAAAAAAMEADILAVFAEVSAMSAEPGAIGAWVTSSGGHGLLPSEMPPPGEVIARRDFPEQQLVDVTLSNGMRVLIKSTDFFDDEIQFSASSWTGLSQLPADEQMAARLAKPIADELGWAGIPREELLDLLAGLRVSLSPAVSAYNRTMNGNCSPTDLEPALQLMHRLFTCNIKSDIDKLSTLRGLYAENIVNRDKDPDSFYSRQISKVVTTNHQYFRAMELEDVAVMQQPTQCDWICRYFDDCFCDPGEWSMVMVGNIDVDTVLPLLCQFLGCISNGDGDNAQQQHRRQRPAKREDCVPLDVKFPPVSELPIHEQIERPMVQALRSRACICFPLEVERTRGTLTALRSLYRLDLATAIVEKQLRETLRFEKGGVYGVSVRTSFSSTNPDPGTPLFGRMSIDFDCDPARQQELLDSTLAELARLQKEAVATEIVASILEIFKRDSEESLRTNGYWIGLYSSVMSSSRVMEQHDGDVVAACRERVEMQQEVWAVENPETVRMTLQEYFPELEHRALITLRPSPATGPKGTGNDGSGDNDGTDIPPQDATLDAQ